jgi:hypothetical protein
MIWHVPAHQCCQVLHKNVGAFICCYISYFCVRRVTLILVSQCLICSLSFFLFCMDVRLVFLYALLLKSVEKLRMSLG